MTPKQPAKACTCEGIQYNRCPLGSCFGCRFSIIKALLRGLFTIITLLSTSFFPCTILLSPSFALDSFLLLTALLQSPFFASHPDDDNTQSCVQGRSPNGGAGFGHRPPVNKTLIPSKAVKVTPSSCSGQFYHHFPYLSRVFAARSG